MRYSNKQNTMIILDDGTSIPCDEGNAQYYQIKHGQGVDGDEDYIAPTIDDVESYEPPVVADEVIIAAGIDALSNIVEAAYTTKNWKASEYNAKKIEAEYILSLADIANVDPEKCRLISIEALEKEKSILELATLVIGKVKAYEAMVTGERQAEGLLKTAVEAAIGQAAKLEAKDAIIEAFKTQVTGV